MLLYFINLGELFMNDINLESIIEKMISYADDISIKYKELKTLELSGLKDSSLYEKVCISLKNNILEESKFYNTLGFSKDVIDYIINFICRKYSINLNQNLESLMHSKNKKFLPAMRVIFKVEMFIKNDYQSIEMFFDKKELDRHFNYQKNLLINYYLVLESHIKQYANTEVNFLESILYLKYLLPFINSSIEEEFCKNYPV